MTRAPYHVKIVKPVYLPVNGSCLVYKCRQKKDNKHFQISYFNPNLGFRRAGRTTKINVHKTNPPCTCVKTVWFDDRSMPSAIKKSTSSILEIGRLFRGCKYGFKRCSSPKSSFACLRCNEITVIQVFVTRIKGWRCRCPDWLLRNILFFYLCSRYVLTNITFVCIIGYVPYLRSDEGVKTAGKKRMTYEKKVNRRKSKQRPKKTRRQTGEARTRAHARTWKGYVRHPGTAQMMARPRKRL